MRIIAGKLRGKKIKLPEDKSTRPLRDLVKESIFNVMEHSKKFNFQIQDSNILDLFSGSGSFGLEAISRGAKNVTFVENYSKATKVLDKNIDNLGCQDFCRIVKNDCFKYLDNFKNNNSVFDLIFIDPPYKEKEINLMIEKIIDRNILKKEGLIILHRHKKDDLELTKKINIFETRMYGISKIIFGK